MGKYYFRYFVFWLPAAIVSLVCNNATLASVLHIGEVTSLSLQYFCAFFMLLGWGLTTAAAGYRFPRTALAFILYYTGINLLLTMILYSADYGSTLYNIMSDYAGILSYVPLAVIVKALLDFNIQQEVVVIILVAVCCLIGYFTALVRRHVRPNPYRPRIG